MKNVVDLRQSKIDSPEYRHQILETEASIFALESSIKSLMKIVKAQMDLTLDISTKNFNFAAEVSTLSRLEADDPDIEDALSKFSSSLSEIEKSRRMMIRQMQEVFLHPLEGVVKKDIAGVRESRRLFERMSDQVDSSLDRYLGKKSKDPNVQESADEVALLRHSFHERSMNYSKELNDFQYMKRCDVIENFLAYMYTNFAFFHQGYETFKDLEPTMRTLNERLKDVRTKGEQIHIESVTLQDEVMLPYPSYYSPIPMDGTSRPSSTAGVATKSGYLMKRGSGKMMQIWSRRWFTIKGNYLIYWTRGKEEQPTVAANLRLSSVKAYIPEPGDQRFCFEILSPAKAYMLQAENEVEMHQWIEVLQNAIGKALNSNASNDGLMMGLGASKEKLNHALFDQLGEGDSEDADQNQYVPNADLEIRKAPRNEVCADCQADAPDWASINLGILLCIECSGIHRSLGVQTSKVRSLTLDRWDRDLFAIMSELGNKKINDIYEANYNPDSGIVRATPKSLRAEKEKWIKAKYVDRLFVKPEKSGLSNDQLGQDFWEAAVERRLIVAILHHAWGADVDWRNPNKMGRTALHQATSDDDHRIVQFLINLNADPSAVDSQGWTALHYAVARMSTPMVKAMLKRNCRCDIKDIEGKTPIDLAVETADPDIVTLLRISHFEREQAMGSASNLNDRTSETSPVSTNKPLPSPEAKETLSDDTRSSSSSPVSSKSPSKLSPTKSKSFFTTNGKLEAPGNRTRGDQRNSAIITSLSSASLMANNAMSSAGKYFKSNFGKLHAEAAPDSETRSSTSDSEILRAESRPGSFIASFRPQYNFLRRDGNSDSASNQPVVHENDNE